MNANPADPRERLNYFNGQRLTASDFRTEQGHHDGMRRILNSSLYSAGVVTGLQVSIDPANNHHVIVSHGLAFDYLGREIFLPEDVSVLAMGAPSTTKGLVFGNLLVVSYREQRKNTVAGGCAVTAHSAPCTGDLTWGAPTRIAADVMFEVLDSWPAAESGRVVIAQLELNAQCQVERVLPGARQYAMPVKPQKTRPISLEGEKDIDIANPKTLHFHIDGGAPDRAVLMLRARPFSSLFYTEIGEHTHALDITIEDHPAVPDHVHTMTNVKTDQQLDPETLHFTAEVFKNAGDYTLRQWSGAGSGNILNPGDEVTQDLWSDKSGGGPTLRITNTLHSHTVDSSAATDPAGGIPALTHTFDKKEAESFGSTALVQPPHQVARNGKPEYAYVHSLRVLLDGNNDITDVVLAQLEKRQAGQWASLGDGSSGHALASDEGSGEIDLLALGFELDIGAHTLTLKLVTPKVGDSDYSGDPNNPGDRGGQIQYNLYID